MAMSNDLTLSTCILNPDPHWTKPIYKITYQPIPEDFCLFDQTGYDLTPIERMYAYANETELGKFGEFRNSIKKDWFSQAEKYEGAVLNHSHLFERKAFAGEALEQLQSWSKRMPLCNKLIACRAKWGLDFSMDYVDQEGNAFEVLHWEYDCFEYDEAQVRKLQVQAKIATTDWDDAAKSILRQKDQWYHLEYFPQSEWKCKYFGIVNERFKMVIWQ